jgi:F1F0 ATPase subunit 2
MTGLFSFLWQFIAGLLIGAMFYGALWWTVSRVIAKSLSGAYLPVSFLLRTLIALGGFYVVAFHDWRAMLTCLAGFLVARLVVARLTRPRAKSATVTVSGVAP